jgi:4-carboxymuconolactone decarboxylase
MSRVPVLAPEQMNEAQRKVYEDILRTRGGKWFHGPYDPMLHQPRMAEPAQQLGEFVRYQTSLNPKLVELAILVVARHWDCEVEWYQHAAIAAKSGLSAALIEALRHDESQKWMRTRSSFLTLRCIAQEHRIADALMKGQAETGRGRGGGIDRADWLLHIHRVCAQRARDFVA